MVEKSYKIICLKGKKVILRPFDIATDFELFFKWVNDPEVIRYLLRLIPTYRHQQLAWFQSLPNSTDIIFSVETIQGNTIGTIGLENINYLNGTACTWQIIGEKQFRGQGFGTEAKILLLDYGFNTLRLEKINSEIIAANKISLHYNKKLGFREEGVLRNQVFREGKRHDLVLLGILREEFAEILEKYREISQSAP
jgi:RimJ/RimL family protein N-acetyltransferase